jgi:nuclear RNA export factor
MHGEFEEQTESATEKSLRSFSRTFILGPGAPGGPQIRVVSDMLTLRPWAPLALPQISSISPETHSTSDPEQQKREAITMQLVEKTGMTPAYANLCLTETRWNIEQAFIAFTANKVSLLASITSMPSQTNISSGQTTRRCVHPRRGKMIMELRRIEEYMF